MLTMLTKIAMWTGEQCEQSGEMDQVNQVYQVNHVDQENKVTQAGDLGDHVNQVREEVT